MNLSAIRKKCEWNDLAARKFARSKTPDAHCSLNEVSSDIDYYSDLGKYDGIVVGSQWQHDRILPIIECLLRVIEMQSEALEKIGHNQKVRCDAYENKNECYEVAQACEVKVQAELDKIAGE